MAILNFLLNTVGQSGDVPVFVYFNTNDTPSTVIEAGYLNKFVAQGNTLNVSDLALVTTQSSPSAPPVPGLFQITFSGGNWTLVPYQNVTPSGEAWLLTGNNNAAAFPTNFVGTTNSVPLSLGVDSNEIIYIGTDLSVSIITDTAPVTISALNASITTFGNITLSAAGQISLPILKTGTTLDQLYYNSSNGDLSWGALPTPVPSGGGWTWIPVTTNTALVANNAYVNVNNSSQISYTLPATAAFGATFLVAGFGAGNWQIAPTGSQTVLLGGSTVASGHTLTSVSGTAVAALIVCVVANTTFMVYSASGSINIV